MKKKIIVSALALAIGTGLAGSVTSTIAWYQYSTRTTAAYVGVAGGVKGNLQMRFKEDGQADDEGWVTKILKDDMATYLSSKSRASNVVPITSGSMARDGAVPNTFYGNPIYMREDPEFWKEATAANYVKIELEIRFVETDANGVETNLAKDLYLSDLYLEQDASDTTHEDLSSAVRFHIAAYSDPAAKTNRLISKNGGTTDTCGQLDLNGDGVDDVKYTQAGDKYGFTSGGATTPVMYGGTGSQQISYSATVDAPSASISPMIADIESNEIDGSKKLGTTLSASDAFLSVDVTIWVEGWQKLPAGDANAKAIWDFNDFANSKFDVGFEFDAK